MFKSCCLLIKQKFYTKLINFILSYITRSTFITSSSKWSYLNKGDTLLIDNKVNKIIKVEYGVHGVIEVTTAKVIK